MVTREQASLDDRWRACQELPHLRRHWYWRPGWRVGRSFYTWHLTFDDAQPLHQLVDRVQEALDLPGLDLVPREGLHLTMQGIGFTDETGADEVDAVVRAAAHPNDAKTLGRQARGFDETTWVEHRYPLVVASSVAKFDQHADLRAFLLGRSWWRPARSTGSGASAWPPPIPLRGSQRSGAA